MLEGSRLDPGTPMSCEHVCLMTGGFKSIHFVVEGVTFNPSHQNVTKNASSNLSSKPDISCDGGQDKKADEMIHVAVNIPW